ncbi:MAG: hypothetical protein FD177_2088 [Desulfovibrionaceae bacterium]|nr:MAG: hypothetical protein FD177_2088 [Desulfovibrionaceae bacterium]
MRIIGQFVKLESPSEENGLRCPSEGSILRSSRPRWHLEALIGELTLSELASKYDVHPTMIASWKRQAKDGMESAFSGKAAAVKKDGEAEIRDLHVEQRAILTPS